MTPIIPPPSQTNIRAIIPASSQSDVTSILGQIIKVMTTTKIVIFVVFFTSYFEAKLALADKVVRRGSFIGASGHEASGDISIIQRDDGSYYAQLEKNFSLDGAPDPFVGFGNASFDKKTRFSELRKNKGQQKYDIPSKINPLSFKKFYLWCKAYSVTLGVATLRP